MFGVSVSKDSLTNSVRLKIILSETGNYNYDKLRSFLSSAQQKFCLESRDIFISSDFFDQLEVLSKKKRTKPVKNIKMLIDPVSIQMEVFGNLQPKRDTINFLSVAGINYFVMHEQVFISKHLLI